MRDILLAVGPDVVVVYAIPELACLVAWTLVDFDEYAVRTWEHVVSGPDDAHSYPAG